MGSGDKQNIMVEGKIIEVVTELEYLGQLMSFYKRGNNEISKKIHRGWSNSWNLKLVCRGKLGMRKKMKML